MKATTLRRRLEIQGFEGLTDEQVRSVGPWARFTPALCLSLMLLATALAMPWFHVALAAIVSVGAVTPRHPFDYVYNYGVRRLTGTAALPPNGAPRRFACGVAAVWLLAIAAAFFAGAPLVAYALAGVMALIAGLVSVTHICIPSMIFRACEARLVSEPGAVTGQ